MTNTRASFRRPSAFTLVELLTVIFIIGLLIAILIPSLGAARNTAKKLSSQKTLSSIDAGLQLFRNDHEKDFPQTNGYPPSFVHPPIKDANPFFTTDQSREGRFPFIEGYPRVYGAHWLPFFLVGKDARGYINRRDVPEVGELRKNPSRWYEPDATGDPNISIPRSPLYVDPNGVNLISTENLPGQPPEDYTVLFPNCDGPDRTTMKRLPVIADAFDQPILYYVANKHGRETNMVEESHASDDYASPAPQRTGPPFYFHQDNAGFTGDKDHTGWNFSTSANHHIADPGHDLSAAELMEEENRDTFARYILDRKVYQNLRDRKEAQQQIDQRTPLRPANAESYILLSPGVDGVYGTSDDVSNLPPWPDE